MTIHRHVSSGSSWGANPFEQHIGLAGARTSRCWKSIGQPAERPRFSATSPPTSAIEVTEFAYDYQKLDRKPIRTPK